MRMSCPACGARYERGEARCGVDGCALVPFVDRRMGAVLGGVAALGVALHLAGLV